MCKHSLSKCFYYLREIDSVHGLDDLIGRSLGWILRAGHIRVRRDVKMTKLDLLGIEF